MLFPTMPIRILPVALAALLMAAACVRSEEHAADSAAQPLSPPASDSVEVVAHMGVVKVEHVFTRGAEASGIREARVRVRVRGRTVLAEEFSTGMDLAAYWPLSGSRTLVLLVNSPGGTACDRNHRIVEVLPNDSTHVTDEFGACAGAPDTLWFDRSGALWMRFSPYVRYAVEIEPGFVSPPPQTWVYRGGGRLERAP